MTGRLGRTSGALRALMVAALVCGLAVSGPAPSPAGADGSDGAGAPVGFRAITVGSAHSCAILDNGSVKCWGFNASGQLGLGDTQARGDTANEMGDNLPTVNLGTGRTATELAAGANHTCALLDDHTVKCWGNGGAGQLGYGDNASRGDIPSEMGDNLPAVDLGTGHTAVAIAAGGDSTCAILEDATLKCWGDNVNGKLGTGNTNDRGDNSGEMGNFNVAVDLGTVYTVSAVTVGTSHTCAILEDATVKCWGFAGSGILGDGQTANSRGDAPGEMGNALPVVDLGTGHDAIAISAGAGHTCAVLETHRVKCWGVGGRLGNGNANAIGDGPGEMGNTLAPVDLGTGARAVGVSVGHFHTCAVLADHSVKCWGSNSGGIGYGSNAVPGDAPGEMGDALGALYFGTDRTAVAVAGGGNASATTSCALLDGGLLKCWGAGAAGVLGIGTTDNRSDGPGEMGDNLPFVDVGTDRLAGPQTRVTASITADETSVVVGQVIHYHVTITNAGGVTLTNTYVSDHEVLDCERMVASLAPGASSTADCEWTATADDVPAMANVVSVSTDQGATAVSRVRRTRVDPVSIRPDAQLRLGAGAFVGDGVYNATGASQTRSTTVPNLGTATFTVRVQNDGNVVDDLTVLGQPTTSRYTVTYKDGPTNVTSQVVAGTYALNDLAPGATHDLTVTIKAKAGTPVNNLVSRLVTVTSSTDTSKKDAVKATVRRR